MSKDNKLKFIEFADGEGGFASNHDTQRAMSGIVVDQRTIRDKLDDFLRGVVAIRCEKLDAQRLIESAICRRVEIAVSSATAKIEEMVKSEVERQVVEIVRARLANTPTTFSFKLVGGYAPDKECNP